MLVQESIAFNVQLTRAEFIRVSMWLILRPLKRGAICAFIVTLTGLCALGGNPAAFSWYALFYVAIPSIVLAVGAVLIFLNLWRRWAKQPSLRGMTTLNFLPERVVITGETARHELAWLHIKEAEETKDRFLLFLSKSAAIVIPKRCMTGESQRAAFRALLTEQLGPKARLLPKNPRLDQPVTS